FECSKGRDVENDICIIPASGGTARTLTAVEWSLDPSSPAWSADGKTIYFSAETNVNVHLFAVAAAGGPARQITTEARQLLGSSPLFTNPRGSSGYGHAFTYATRARWGMEDYQDLMQAVDVAMARNEGAVDTARMAVLGGSYGGFMTNWIVGHTNRFRVAQTD